MASIAHCLMFCFTVEVIIFIFHSRTGACGADNSFWISVMVHPIYCCPYRVTVESFLPSLYCWHRKMKHQIQQWALYVSLILFWLFATFTEIIKNYQHVLWLWYFFSRPHHRGDCDTSLADPPPRGLWYFFSRLHHRGNHGNPCPVSQPRPVTGQLVTLATLPAERQELLFPNSFGFPRDPVLATRSTLLSFEKHQVEDEIFLYIYFRHITSTGSMRLQFMENPRKIHIY